MSEEALRAALYEKHRCFAAYSLARRDYERLTVAADGTVFDDDVRYAEQRLEATKLAYADAEKAYKDLLNSTHNPEEW